MRIRFRTALAALLSIALIVELPAGASTSNSPSISRGSVLSVASAARPPVRIPVAEPTRPRISPLPISAIRPKAVSGVRPANGVRAAGPRMLHPSEIDRLISKARQRASLGFGTASRAKPPVSVVSPAIPAPRPIVNPPGARIARPGVRIVQSLPSNAAASGTGINPWWRYQEENLPGGGHTMVNVGTGNLLLQDDDMTVPHKGISLAFRRTYNSQSQHDMTGSDGNGPGLYGNGWTNTFDAHLSGTTPGTISVWDIDGARYDYTLAPDGITWIPPAGQHATLTSDGGCGSLWTKKSGTTYYFWTPANGPCSSGVYAGRLYQIIGRNRNTYITFGYSWDSSGGKVSAIVAQTESGSTATLAFADFNGHRELSQLTFPDGVTSVSYSYDSTGNLTTVSRPPNNASGIRPLQLFGYVALGTDSILQWTASPRWCASTCGSDGAFRAFVYAGTNPSSSTVSAIALCGVVNPIVPDGTASGALQPGYSTAAYCYAWEYYTTGVTTPTFRNTDGHMTNWIVDGSGRPTQTQECTSSTNQGQVCNGVWLLLNEGWDISNNLTSQVDARGYETDFAYDAVGNTIAVGEPMTATSQGTFRPTKLYDYDTNNNVTHYCDESETHLAGADWVSPPATSDSLCSSHAVAHQRITFDYPSYEPFGRLTTITSPLGYNRRFSYGTTQQAGSDYGLPTAVTGDSFTQRDGTVLTPTQSFWYDLNGSLRCYSKGVGTSV